LRRSRGINIYSKLARARERRRQIFATLPSVWTRVKKNNSAAATRTPLGKQPAVAMRKLPFALSGENIFVCLRPNLPFVYPFVYLYLTLILFTQK
jgi:hypothetical protein